MSREDFVKHWQYKKQGDVVAAASEMKGSRDHQEDRIIFQKKIDDDIFLYAIFDGHGGDHISGSLQKHFSELVWGEEFKKSLVAHSEQGPQTLGFEFMMNKMSENADIKFYQEDVRVLCEWTKQWHIDTIGASDENAKKLAQCCVYLMLERPSDEDLLAVLREYVQCINKVSDGLSADKKTDVEKSYKFLLDMKGSYKNLRRISSNYFDGLEGKFRDFCVKACQATDLFNAVALLNQIVFESLFTRDIISAAINKHYVMGETQNINEKTWKEAMQVFKDNDLKFSEAQKDVLNSLASFKTYAKSFKNINHIPTKYTMLRLKKIEENVDYEGTKVFKFSRRKFPEQKLQKTAITTGTPLDLWRINEACSEKLKAIDKDFILGNNTSIHFQGSTALLAFLNVKNGTIVNVNIGDSLSTLKTDQHTIRLNSELTFGVKEEQQRTNNMDGDFSLQEGRLFLWGEGLEPSRTFGDFTYKTTKKVSFAKWSENDRCGNITGFEDLGPTTKAECSVVKIGKGAEAFIMGCDGVWKKSNTVTVSRMFGIFYLQHSDVVNLQQKQDIESQGKTNPVEIAQVSIRTNHKGIQQSEAFQMEDLKKLEINDIDAEKRLVLSLAQVQNWSYPSGDNISIIYVDLRLLARNSKSAASGIFSSGINDKVESAVVDGYLNQVIPGEKANANPEVFANWLGTEKQGPPKDPPKDPPKEPPKDPKNSSSESSLIKVIAAAIVIALIAIALFILIA